MSTVKHLFHKTRFASFPFGVNFITPLNLILRLKSHWVSQNYVKAEKDLLDIRVGHVLVETAHPQLLHVSQGLWVPKICLHKKKSYCMSRIRKD